MASPSSSPPQQAWSSPSSSLDTPFSSRESLFFLVSILAIPYLFWFPMFYLAAMVRTYPERPSFSGLWLSPRALVVAYAACGALLVDHPRVLRERMSKSGLHGEKPGEPWKEVWAQRILLVLSVAEIFVSCFDAAGRVGADEMKAINVVGSIIMVVSFVLISWVCRANSYASKVVYKQEGQQLITTGPYRLVRHPMYSFFTLFFAGLPLMLGSPVWGMIPSLLVVLTLMWRTNHEEEFLVKQFGGQYRKYRQDVPWRMFPGLF
jgi:protein-S-isoprenylcysteine O-methyltransferase Ste14